MAGISGMGTTYNLPNYGGSLYMTSPTDTPFFSAISAVSTLGTEDAMPGGATTDTEFEWQTQDLRTPSQRVKLEGQDAPTAEARVRTQVKNVVEIHQEAINLSYTKLAAIGRRSGLANDQRNPVSAEQLHQIRLELLSIGRDVNYSLLKGTYQLPADNTTARQTRGILPAITTNVTDYTEATFTGATATASTDNIGSTGHGLTDGDQIIITAITDGAPLTTDTVYWVTSSATNTFKVAASKDGQPIDITADGTAIAFRKLRPLTMAHVNQLMQDIFTSGGSTLIDTRALVLPPHLKSALSIAAANAYGKYTESSRTIGGVNFSTIQTDFGEVNTLVERLMPAGTLAPIALDECMPVYLDVPGKGHMFVEPLAKVGAQEKAQIYGEVGLKYGNEASHAKGQYLGSQ